MNRRSTPYRPRPYGFFTDAICTLYRLGAEIVLVGETPPIMRPKLRTFRTRRPLLVKARQCSYTTVLFTGVGERKVLPGDWIIEGENHERYVVDNTFFQRTFAPVCGEPVAEERKCGS
jgi:hypothetical protein